jgi:hypothetical protein
MTWSDDAGEGGPQSDRVQVEAEAIRLVNLAGVSIDELARTLRLEPDEMVRLAAEPSYLRPLPRMMLAALLRRHAVLLPDQDWATFVAETLWNSSIAIFGRHLRAELQGALAIGIAEAEARVAALLLEELGPEVYEGRTSPPDPPRTER